MSKEAESKASSFPHTDGGKSKSNAVDIPAISLPRGGGAIKGIDEKFGVNAANGTASFSIPLPVAAARGTTPELTLTYNSGAGNSTFGLGWQLRLPSIKRKTDQQLPQYTDGLDADTFLLADAEDLVPVFRKDADGNFTKDAEGNYKIDEKDAAHQLPFTIRTYQPRIESSFTRIERWQHKTTGEIKWRTITKDNITTLLGWSAASRIADPKNTLKIFEWLPEFTFDDKGNCTQYSYKKEDDKGFNPALLHNRSRTQNGQLTYTNLYLAKLLYGNQTPFTHFLDERPAETDYLFQTVFDYGEYDPAPPYTPVKEWDARTDAFSGYKAGFEIRTTRLCKRVLLFHYFEELPGGSALVKSLNFGYNTSSEDDFTFLQSITAYGYIKQPNGTYTHKNLPPMEFTYQQHDWNKTIRSIPQGDVVQAPTGAREPSYQFTDLFNEGLAGILSEQAGGWYYKRNLGQGNFDSAKPVNPRPSFAGLGGSLRLADLNGDGGKQLVSFGTQTKGYFELSGGKEWQGFRAFTSLPNINFNDANTRLIDLDGDGRAEVVISEEQVFTWYPSEGRNGFGRAHRSFKSLNEEEGPHILFADPKQSIYLADMSGDGMTDIVRIRNGEVCYWPNLGYGKFGARVKLENPPVFDHPDAFNPAYLRLADVDGSGTTDIIYLGKNTFTCWRNLSGNRFSTTPITIDHFVGIDPQSKISVADLLGNGMACIVWAGTSAKHRSASIQYIDLMNGKKPYIMTGYKNNMGKEVSLVYTPSTHYYLEDKAAGNPWQTQLHFPVHCVSKTITEDKITGHKFVTEYKYHHGYYDHAEREFRGFGMVEQIDAETFAHWQKDNQRHLVEAPLQQEPVVTKTWYHTGALLQQEKMLDLFARDYWYEEMQRQGFPVDHHEVPLPDGQLPQLSNQERREAFRACKGMELRSEIFAKDAHRFDDTAEARKRELTPFAVSTHNCVIRLLQPQGTNKHAVFAVHASETRTYNYERNAEDPRIAHSLHIKTDPYGHALESAAIVYPRMQPDTSLPYEAQQAQNKTTILYTAHSYTNDVLGDDVYRLRVPSEERTWELTGVAKNATWYAVNDFDNILSQATELPYQQSANNPVAGHVQKRLVEHTRHIYYKDDLKGALPLHQLGSKAIPFETYQLAYTPELVSGIFGKKVEEAVLIEGGFTHSGGDSNWWVPSGSSHYIGEKETVADARRRFYSPIAWADPLGAVTKAAYYRNYFLFIEETTDALGNTTKVDLFNFRTLSPQRMRDANNNITETITDELGLVKAMAILGKGDEADNLAGLTEFTTEAEKAAITSFFNATDSTQLTSLSKTLSQQATMRFVYDFDAWVQYAKPVAVASIIREAHYKQNEEAPLQLSFEYSNGLNKVVMTKKQAAPGLAKQITIHPDQTYTIAETDTAASNPRQLRWIGTGRTVLNNKGNPVKQYEPYFSGTHRYEDLKELVETGSTPKYYYDALGRLIKTEMPDASFSAIRFDSWKQAHYDANDTILDTSWYTKRTNRLIDAELRAEAKDPAREKEAADNAASHANTPHVEHFDVLGRPVLSVEHNRHREQEGNEFYHTFKLLDVEGNLRAISDARGNNSMLYKYDMLGNKVWQQSMDAGQRWFFINILDAPLSTRDERGHVFQYFYDALHRPTHSIVINEGANTGEQSLNHVFDRIIYGEELLLPDRSNIAALQARNVLGKPVQHFDTGGLIDTPAYDCKGQPLTTSRQLFAKYKEVANWTDEHLHTNLEADIYTCTTVTDALGRITQQSAPDGSITWLTYNESGLLGSVSVKHPGARDSHIYIKAIDYNEKGHRNKIIYGNEVVTRFYYDKETFRLKRLETRRKNNDLLQDWYYTYDPVGNITHIENKAIPETFFDNKQITGLATYTYDALYRLITATGRENNAPVDFNGTDNWQDAAFMQAINPGDPMAMRQYTQQFQYDSVGNILAMQHQAEGNNWTRTYQYEEHNNRLLSTRVGKTTYTYPHHTHHGFITAMPHLEAIGWNFKEEVIATSRQHRKDGGAPETTYYQYDRQGKRIRKITELQAGAGATPAKKEERIYIGGYEHFKKHSGNAAGLERTSLSLLDGEHRFVIIESRNEVDDGTEKQLVRYQLHNHLGSAALELDHTAQVISYEEYHPYGTTAYQARNTAIRSAAKRYRYTGMERDEESGLEYHHARYYLSWLGRWLSADPLYTRSAAGPHSSGNKTVCPPFTCGDISNGKTSKDQASTTKPSHPYTGSEDIQPAAAQRSQDKAPPTDRAPGDKQVTPGEQQAVDLKNLNLYAYATLNPIVYHDPTGQEGIIQAWYKGYQESDTCGKVALGILFIFAWLLHVLVNLFILAVAVIVQPFSPIDFSWGAPQSILGVALGSIAVLLGADVSLEPAMGAKVELPGYMKISGRSFGFSLGPVVFGSPGSNHWSHEFGHTWQSRALGPFYLLVAAIPSLINSFIHPNDQSDFYTEEWANAWKH